MQDLSTPLLLFFCSWVDIWSIHASAETSPVPWPTTVIFLGRLTPHLFRKDGWCPNLGPILRQLHPYISLPHFQSTQEQFLNPSPLTIYRFLRQFLVSIVFPSSWVKVYWHPRITKSPETLSLLIFLLFLNCYWVDSLKHFGSLS